LARVENRGIEEERGITMKGWKEKRRGRMEWENGSEENVPMFGPAVSASCREAVRAGKRYLPGWG
jgi:hypothetical protein